jgi:hypothetical protein
MDNIKGVTEGGLVLWLLQLEPKDTSPDPTHEDQKGYPVAYLRVGLCGSLVLLRNSKKQTLGGGYLRSCEILGSILRIVFW